MKVDCKIERLGASHDRTAFSCGVGDLDRYLKQQIRQDVKKNLAAAYVLRTVDSMHVIGYYTLSSTSVQPERLPEDVTRRLPYPVLPAILIGRLAVDRNYQGQSLGKQLLFDALYRSLHADIAAMAVIVDAIDEAARSFYERYDFQRFRDRELELFLPMKTIERMFDQTGVHS